MATDILITTPKSYPWPDGMTIPNLMPFQAFAFNGDPFLAAEVLRLKEAHGLVTAVETGTCLGSTALWFAENFHAVYTFEVNPSFAEIAIARGAGRGLQIRDSVDGLRDLFSIKPPSFKPFMFLDAHWSQHCPLLDELDAIAAAKVKPCLIIHDFQVPGLPEAGYDRMPGIGGHAFNIDLIRGHLDRIYGGGKWKHNYPTQVAGANRGWISIEPCL
jgi:hypothetical protein